MQFAYGAAVIQHDDDSRSRDDSSPGDDKQMSVPLTGELQAEELAMELEVGTFIIDDFE